MPTPGPVVNLSLPPTKRRVQSPRPAVRASAIRKSVPSSACLTQSFNRQGASLPNCHPTCFRPIVQYAGRGCASIAPDMSCLSSPSLHALKPLLGYFDCTSHGSLWLGTLGLWWYTASPMLYHHCATSPGAGCSQSSLL